MEGEREGTRDILEKTRKRKETEMAELERKRKKEDKNVRGRQRGCG